MQVRANGLAIEVDVQGRPDGEPLLLIMGLGMQLIAWPQALVDALVDLGFRVIRFDNRDAGLSQGFDRLGVPNLWKASLRYLAHLPVNAPYTLEDMAEDASGVLDALGIDAAHVCGASMGGMVAQVMAYRRPERVRSLTLMMTTSGARHLPQAGWRIRRALMQRLPHGATFEQRVEHLYRVLWLIGSPAFRPEPQVLRARVAAAIQRAYRPAGLQRQLTAVIAHGDRSPMLGKIRVPTLVIHGDADPLIPVEAGRDLARKIPEARGEFVRGMGHDLPDALATQFGNSIKALAHSKQRLL